MEAYRSDVVGGWNGQRGDVFEAVPSAGIICGDDIYARNRCVMAWKIAAAIEFAFIVVLILDNWNQQSTLETREQQLQDLLTHWQPKQKREHGKFTK